MTEATEVTAATDLFSLDADGRAVAFFAARRRPRLRHGAAHEQAVRHVLDAVDRLAGAGWRLSVGDMFGESGPAMIYQTGFSHDIDVAGVFEAPSLTEAYEGIAALERAGWDRLFATAWHIGQREFNPVPSPLGRDPEAAWAFFALWEWNEAWQAATPQERKEYDLECDEAFSWDVGSGISIAGRHRLDLGSSWHHLGIWEVPTFDHITEAMAAHERVADFKFTTSRHYVGRRRTLADYLGVAA